MVERGILGDITSLIENAILHKEDLPRYSLLLCRMAAEAILMDAHLKMIDDGEPKRIITLGDINNKKLGLEFEPLIKTGLIYIQSVTNEYAHYQLEGVDVPNTKRVDKVIDELEDILRTLKSKHTIQTESLGQAPSKVVTAESWHELLELELDEYIKTDGSQIMGRFSYFEEYKKTIGKASQMPNAKWCICGTKKPRKMKKRAEFDKLHLDCADTFLDREKWSEEQERIKNSGGVATFVKESIREILIGCYSIHGGQEYTFAKNIEFPFTNHVISGPISNITPFEPFHLARFWMFLFTREHPKIFLKRDWRFMQFE
tara:strand:+ start:188 stop:1135 length:948 start_codon:yes stop_codon:yes gene_type:complete